MSNPRTRNTLLYLFFVFIIFVIILGIAGSDNEPSQIQFTELVNQIQNENVNSIRVVGDQLYIQYNNGTQSVTTKAPEISAEEQLTQHGITPAQISSIAWEFEQPNNWAAVGFSVITTLLPIILLGGLIFFMLRQAQGSNNQAMAFGKSRARMFNSDQPSVTFDDVAGADEAKEELAEVVEFLKEPDKFIQLGARIPKGVLLVGSPGTGKTLLAKAVAGEAGVPFFTISGSEFVEMFVGVGASRVRDLFTQAKRHSPCIIFVDEIDAVGRHRGAGLGGSHDEREQTLNQILVEMDGFDTDTNVIVVAATNRPDILDPALLRPGRFDRRVVLDRPDMRGREAILKVHVRGKPLASDVDLKSLAKSTPGFVGADIENMVNEAAILAARKNKKTIGENDFHSAIERIIIGPERKSRVISPNDQRITAYHEAGHAVAAYFLPDSDPVRKVTIIPRGMAAGVTIYLPNEDSLHMTRSRLKSQIVMALAGRAAEELVFGEITTGAMNDLEQVAKVARAMVTRFGMSDKLGPMMFGQKEEMVFLGREISEQRDYSEAVAEEIDSEVRAIVTWAYDEARRILSEHRDKLDAVSERLLEVETLEADEFLAVIEGRHGFVPGVSDTPKPRPKSNDKETPEEDDSLPSLGKPGTAPSPA
ncbi:MAG: ATP-dependent zinc metalloprotease FtsH [Anaerolineaceae bacterium]|nr:ATP-dependent zinc metalloprotease FtsH [Anaerolineaceae bacterium]